MIFLIILQNYEPKVCDKLYFLLVNHRAYRYWRTSKFLEILKAVSTTQVKDLEGKGTLLSEVH
jgi:hypothetical protein